ncbi:uncharacterized protein LOC111327456 [Stylophora pistillata]|uniref:uncharacterized protein LOC111327456 n=1 Tax=Stylophora pistillata TaxID=50429 RepID=UPI000C044669|nr:uncharacterized protein LOC111327456 [Stylophora pistillata]
MSSPGQVSLHGLMGKIQELYAASNNAVPRPTPQKSASLELTTVENQTPQKSNTFQSVPGFDEVVNIANSFHNKHSQSCSSNLPLSDHLVTPRRSKCHPDPLGDACKEFAKSPFGPSVNDTAIKAKVNMAISRLEEDSSAKHSSQNRGSQFDEHPSDSRIRSQATSTDVMSERSRMTLQKGRTNRRGTNNVDNVTRAQTVDSREEIHISFENNGDDEINIETEDFNSAGNEKNHSRIKSLEKTLSNAIFRANSGQPAMQVPEENGVPDKEDILNNTYYSVVDENIPGTPEEIVRERRKKSAKGQGKPERRRLYKEESDGSSSDRVAQKSSKINILKPWYVKALKTQTHMGIIVEGQRSEDPVGEWWHSTAIVKRVSAKCVQTKSGSQYKLHGPIDENVTLQQGFPPDFVKAFKQGFPKNWISLVADYFNSQSSEEEEQTQKHIDNKKGKELQEADHSTITTPTQTRAKRRNQTSAFKTPQNRPLPQEVEIKTTRSGRMVKPPLAWWRGQRIITDGHHNFEGIHPGCEERTPISSMYNVNIKISMVEELSPKKKGQLVSSSENSNTMPRVRKGKTARNENKSSGRSGTENDTDENIKRPLFFSPKKTVLKDQDQTKNNISPKKRPQRKSLNSSKSGSQGSGCTVSAVDDSEHKSSINQPLVQEHEMLCEDVSLAPIITPKKNTPQLSSLDRNNQKCKKKSSNEKLSAESESEEILSPFKRVLRSQRSKGGDLTSTSANPDKFSDADSEDSQAESSAQLSEKKNEGAYLKQPEKEGVRLKSLISRKSNMETHGTLKNDKKVKTGSKRKGNTPSDIEKVLGKKQKLEVCRQTAQNEIPCTDGEIKMLNGATENGKRVETRSKRAGKTQTVSEKLSDKKQALKVSRQATKKNSRKISDEVRDETPCTDGEIQTLKGTLEDDKRVETRSRRAGKTQSDSEKISDMKQALKVSRQAINKNSRGISDEVRDETLCTNEEIQTLKGTLEDDERVETRSQRKGKTQSSIEKVFGKKKVSEVSRQTENKNHRRRSFELSDRTRSTDEEIKKLNGTSNNGKSVEIGSKRKGKTQSESGKDSGKKKAMKVSRQTANKDSKKRNDELSDEAPWTDEEITKLNEALHSIPGSTPLFWQKISRKVGTRTAQECQSHHQGHVLVSNRKNPAIKKGPAKTKDPEQKAASQQNVKIVTGGVGTIKRKRELRLLLEQQDVDYEDDIFDSTPFKRKKDLQLPFNLSAHSSDEENNEDDDQSDTEHSASHKTPSSRTPSSRFRPLGPLSISSTPGAEFVSPSLLQLVNRNDMDHYIYRMQQGKRGTQASGKQKSKLIRTSTPKKPSTRSHFPVITGSDLFEVHPASDQESDDGSQDEYFSDE